MKFVDSKFMWEEPDTVGPSLLGQEVQKFQKFLVIKFSGWAQTFTVSIEHILKNITQWLYFIIYNLDYPTDGTTGGRVSDIG